MPVERYVLPMNLAGQLQLQVKHFARGTYTEFSGRLASLPYNRFFIPLKCKKGHSCRMSDNVSDFLITPGKAYFIPLNRKARLYLDEYLEFISIQFSLELYGGIDLFSRYHSIREIDSKIWKKRAIDAYTEQNPYLSAIKLHGIVFDFVTVLTGTFTPEDWDSVARFAEFQTELDYIQSRNHSLATITVEELAQTHGMDRSTFSRKFSRVTGMSPKSFLSGILIKQACRLLIQKKSTIKEVADQLGFDNEFYFSRFFKKFMNISPGQYREEMNKNI